MFKSLWVKKKGMMAAEKAQMPLVKLTARSVPLRLLLVMKSKPWNPGLMLLNKSMMTKMIKPISNPYLEAGD